ncbi:uncharacterized protein UV8b_07143 [Ustilaginoidea virens]|uniref:Uncharacterized protein n=1 Tax=Ustilaginoidea virens TaxID=1159556 RepID=A0A8E5HWS6_USTVR|nr:uncharacterized protein UV8b_07143 [Ustilaginoidea virens]QUC22902.1 hypothetical protein UV8b_07143 [Ustilaginoidea virens]
MIGSVPSPAAAARPSYAHQAHESSASNSTNMSVCIVAKRTGGMPARPWPLPPPGLLALTSRWRAGSRSKRRAPSTLQIYQPPRVSSRGGFRRPGCAWAWQPHAGQLSGSLTRHRLELGVVLDLWAKGPPAGGSLRGSLRQNELAGKIKDASADIVQLRAAETASPGPVVYEASLARAVSQHLAARLDGSFLHADTAGPGKHQTREKEQQQEGKGGHYSVLSNDTIRSVEETVAANFETSAKPMQPPAETYQGSCGNYLAESSLLQLSLAFSGDGNGTCMLQISR